MKRLQCWVVALAALGAGCTGGNAVRTTFDRLHRVEYTQQKCIPDEAVIYMQNMALMRSRMTLGQVNHLELALPPRIIVESLQLRIGPRQIQEFNVKSAVTSKLGPYTRVRIRDVDRYLKADQTLVVEYLTWGVHWSAEYRVDVLPENQLRLQLGAMIQNHWYDLSAMKVTLVAGWVGVSPEHYRSGLERGLAGPGARLAARGGRLPWLAVPPTLRRSGRGTGRLPLVGWSKASPSSAQAYGRTRAFAPELVSKYRIRKVDNTARHRQSNFQMQFADYYVQTRAASARSRALRNQVDGYHLYRNLRINLNRQHKSYLRMASVILSSKPYYLWPADRGESVFTVYKIPNQAGILLPAGTAWIYREGVFVGHDLHHWTPVGGNALLTTTNDGGVAVKRELTHLADRTEVLKLTVRSLAKAPVDVEIFERNPQWDREGRLTYDVAPATAAERGRYHRWRLEVRPGERRIVTLRFQPAPRAPAPATPPRPARR